jgi:tyrosine-protein phosphatase SIW14
MRKYRIYALLLCLFLAAPRGGYARQHSAAPSPRQAGFAEKIHISGIHDAGRVNDFLYRGGQPTEKGVEQLKKLGVDTIVDLRGERRNLLEKERKLAESRGMRLVNIPGNGWSPPRDEQIAQFFSLIRDRPRAKIFVHCWFGGDRTGVFLATYRIAFDGWTPERALEEMRSFHFKGMWHPAMKAYIRKFPARLERSPELARFRQASLTENK